MKKVKHFTNDQLRQLVGEQLEAKLWLNGMMNEIRRRPNEIPCNEGEIPSMVIPFASGEEKAEWGFAAGMSCLTQGEDGCIVVRNAEHFPSCAVLALLSLLYDAGAAAGKEVALKLRYADSPEIKQFLDLLSEAEKKLPRVTIRRFGDLPKEEVPEAANRKAFPLGKGVGVVHQLQQTDVARFAAVVQCVNGSFHVKDNLTITDGSWNVLQEHCPLISIMGLDNTEVNDSDDLPQDNFVAYFAMWFPPDTMAFDGLMLIKEEQAPEFVPRTMPAEVSIRPQEKEQERTEGEPQGKGLFGKIKSIFK